MFIETKTRNMKSKIFNFSHFRLPWGFDPFMIPAYSYSSILDPHEQLAGLSQNTQRAERYEPHDRSAAHGRYRPDAVRPAARPHLSGQYAHYR